MIKPEAYHAKNPRALKNKQKNLPVLCNIISMHRPSQRFSLNGSTNALSLKSRNIFEIGGLPVKVLLILEKAPGHPKSINNVDENVQVIFCH